MQKILSINLIILSAVVCEILNANDSKTCQELCSSCNGVFFFVDDRCECYGTDKTELGSECIGRIKREAEEIGLDLVDCDSNHPVRSVRCTSSFAKKILKTSNVEKVMAKIAEYFKNGKYSFDNQQKNSALPAKSLTEGKKCEHQGLKKSTIKCPCESIESIESIKTKTADQDNYIQSRGESQEDAFYNSQNQYDESTETNTDNWRSSPLIPGLITQPAWTIDDSLAANDNNLNEKINQEILQKIIATQEAILEKINYLKNDLNAEAYLDTQEDYNYIDNSVESPVKNKCSCSRDGPDETGENLSQYTVRSMRESDILQIENQMKELESEFEIITNDFKNQKR